MLSNPSVCKKCVFYLEIFEKYLFFNYLQIKQFHGLLQGKSDDIMTFMLKNIFLSPSKMSFCSIIIIIIGCEP